MSFAEGLLLAYLKVGVLAAAILAVLWAAGKGFLTFYNWVEKAADSKPKADDSSKDGRL
ncbi:MAG: hypothetical protein HYW28_09860 [Rhodospirillales bacterium]|nr:hypothetical protein [Rhodospirillales bacterium]MBI2586156.1 hypothetical protein [Rhodospirillales bacterium]MBI2978337.1 hypothetical protein [Rhodospirillales bacterium]